MDFLAKYELGTAYKPANRNCTVDGVSRYVKQDETQNEVQDDEDIVLTQEDERKALDPFLADIWRRSSGMIHHGDDPIAKKMQRGLESFFIGDGSCLKEHH